MRYRQQLQPFLPLIFGVGLLLLAGMATILFLIGEGEPIEPVVPDNDNIPDAVTVALADLEFRTGDELTLSDLDSYDWQAQRFNDTSLG